MKILAHVHQAVPTHNAGAEWMLHCILERLSTVHGHDCTVMTNRPPRRDDVYEGVRIVCALEGRAQAQLWSRADVVLTHLDATGQAMMQQRTIPKPLVHLVHNHSQLRYHKVTPKRAQLVVANSEWVRRVLNWEGPITTVIPPVWPARCLPPGHRVDAGAPDGKHDAVVLLNVNAAKGADIFFDVARALPHRRFIGVKGAYGHQATKVLPNVEMVKHTPDVWKVYADARVLLMPSSYESWGRTCVEAAWAHVPCIASGTPGLVETRIPAKHLSADAAQGNGYKPDEWIAAVEAMFTDDAAWTAAGAKARTQAEALEVLAKAQVDELGALLEGLAA